MFCENCGSKVEDEWTCCPNCGADLQKTTGIPAKNASAEAGDDSNLPQNLKTDFTVGKSRISGRHLLKILAIIALTCFFCPLYMVSCAGQELITIDGADMTFGFQYMGENVDGNLMFGCMALFPLCNLFFAFRRKKDTLEKLNYKSYSIAIGSCALVFFVKYMTEKLCSAFEGTGLEITPCTALHVMLAASAASAGIGGYLAYLTDLEDEEGEEPKKIFVAAKCVGKILGLGFILLVILSIPFNGELRPSTVPEDYTDEYETFEEESRITLPEWEMKKFSEKFGEPRNEEERECFAKIVEKSLETNG